MALGIEQLQQIGFSQYEAQAYIALLKKSPLNGYELAKQSGIPRPNIYPVLQKMEERGIVLRVNTPEGTHYAPLSPSDLIAKLNHQYQRNLETASQALDEIAAPPTLEYVENLHGYPVLLDHARMALETAQQHMLLIVWPDEAALLAGPLQKAGQRGVHIDTLCMNGCPHPCPYCQGDIFRYQLAPLVKTRWLVLVGDGCEMLAGEITSPETLAIRTRQAMLVRLATGYIQNSIALARILSDLGSRFEDILDPQAIADINTLQSQERWFDLLRQLIEPEDSGN